MAKHPDAVEGDVPMPGDMFGEYRVESLLGTGGMGAVLAASRVRDGRQVAIKTLLGEHLDDPSLRARFKREGKAIQRLKSEHAVRVLEVGEAPDGRPYLVMERLLGDTLSAIARDGPLSIQRAVGYVIEACEALAEAHRKGIIHRDVKPSNLFLADRPGRRPIVKVLDFGISKTRQIEPSETETSTLTITGAVLGSPTYMSPEQLRDPKHIDERADIWSLGLVLHRLIAGKPAFEAETIGQHLMMIVSEPPTPLRRHRPDAPEQLERILRHCIQLHPARRFRTVGQLVAALAPFAPAEVRPIVERIGEPVEIDLRDIVDPDDVVTSRLPRAAEPIPTPKALVEATLSERTSKAVSRDLSSGRRRRSHLYTGAGLALLVGMVVALLWSSRSEQASTELGVPAVSESHAAPPADPVPSAATSMIAREEPSSSAPADPPSTPPALPTSAARTPKIVAPLRPTSSSTSEAKPSSPPPRPTSAPQLKGPMETTF